MFLSELGGKNFDAQNSRDLLNLFLNKTDCSGLRLRNQDFAKKGVHGVHSTPCTPFFATFPAAGGGCQDSNYLGTTLLIRQ